MKKRWLVPALLLALPMVSQATQFEPYVQLLGGGCPQASSTSDPNFCSSFEITAFCKCREKLPAGMCQNMSMIYNAMIARFRSIERACNYQKDVPPQICIDDWNCYLNGGGDSQGGQCSGTGESCQ